MFDILSEVKGVEKDMVKWRRDLHQIPELELDLPKTTKYVKDRLDELGIEYKELVGGNAIVGLIKGSGPGRTIGIRADMDALPIREETGHDFASENGCMHACGHDGHTAILLGAAKVLNNNRDKFKGNVKLLFQPGEEYPGGALPMIKEGALENPRVDGIIGLHNGNINEKVAKGKIGVAYGPIMASMDRFLITVKGKGGHGAYPEATIDPISISGELIGALQRIVSRETSAIEPVVVSICRIEGGFNQNIIPDKVELEGTVRTVNNEVRNRIARRIEEITQGVTSAMGGHYEYTYDFKYPPLINDEEFTEFFVKSAEEIIDKEDIVVLKDPVMGGEDMAYFLEEVPGTFFLLSNIKEVDGVAYPHHNSKFDIDESLFYKGASLFVKTAIDFLNLEE